MSIDDALTHPLGIPAYLVLDQLRRGVPPASILAIDDSLLAEYRNARGYAYPWGNIIEAHAVPGLAWHFALVELWETTDPLRRSPEHAVHVLIPKLQRVVARALRDQLPVELVLAGCHPQSRRDPHVLFSLALVDSARERPSRHWMAAVFLPRLLPEVLDRVRAQLIQICVTDAPSADSRGSAC
jgi:hypothetical protein